MWWWLNDGCSLNQLRATNSNVSAAKQIWTLIARSEAFSTSHHCLPLTWVHADDSAIVCSTTSDSEHWCSKIFIKSVAQGFSRFSCCYNISIANKKFKQTSTSQFSRCFFVVQNKVCEIEAQRASCPEKLILIYGLCLVWAFPKRILITETVHSQTAELKRHRLDVVSVLNGKFAFSINPRPDRHLSCGTLATLNTTLVGSQFVNCCVATLHLCFS